MREMSVKLTPIDLLSVKLTPPPCADDPPQAPSTLRLPPARPRRPHRVSTDPSTQATAGSTRKLPPQPSTQPPGALTRTRFTVVHRPYHDGGAAARAAAADWRLRWAAWMSRQRYRATAAADLRYNLPGLALLQAQRAPSPRLYQRVPNACKFMDMLQPSIILW